MTKQATFNCLHCGSEKTISNKHSFQLKYCSNACQAEYENQQRINKWLIGEELGWTGKTAMLKAWLRRHLKATRGSACSRCGWDGRHPLDGSSLTEIDHKDGDAHNCTPENLEILCPNCHSMTHTFRARNKNSKRSR